MQALWVVGVRPPSWSPHGASAHGRQPHRFLCAALGRRPQAQGVLTRPFVNVTCWSRADYVRVSYRIVNFY